MDIVQMAKQIEKCGGRLYLVGGAVRDKLLQKINKDEDYCIVGLTEEKFLSLFPNAIPRGKSFLVYEIEGKEFAFARKEIKMGTGHKEFVIKADETITIQEDLERRDITINSMAIDVLTGDIIDLYGGKKDLENKIIRRTGKAFSEDPLRIYRVARFAANLQFTVEKETLKEMTQMKKELESLSSERVFEELKKALQTEKPSIFFETLKKAEVLEVHFKEIYRLIGSLQPEKYHPEGDSYNHTMQVLDIASRLTQEELQINKEKALQIRFSALVHDLGKGTTPKKMQPHHYGHEERGEEAVGKLANRLRIPNSWKKCGKIAAKEHMRGGKFDEMRPATKVDFITRVDKSILGLDGLEIVVKADRTRGDEDKTKEEIFTKIGKECLTQVTAKQIQEKYSIKEGIQVGELLKKERIEWMKRHKN